MDTIRQTKIPDQGQTQHYDIIIELGDSYACVGNHEQAQRCYEKAASLAPDEAAPYIGIAVIAMQTGNIEDAETAFCVARRLEPDNSKAYCGLAMVCQEKKRYLQAFELYLRCLELDCDNMTALLGLFQVSCQMGSFSKVIQYLQSYLNMHPDDNSVMFCLATLLFKDKQPAKARELLLHILKANSKNCDAVNLLEEVEHTLAQNKL